MMDVHAMEYAEIVYSSLARDHERVGKREYLRKDEPLASQPLSPPLFRRDLTT